MKRMNYRDSTRLFSGAVLLLAVLAGSAIAAEPHPPATVQAGKAFSIPVDGSGKATLYLLGPDHVAKRSVGLGGEVQMQANDVRIAGRYQVIVCQQSCNSATFEVRAAEPSQLSFFLHPSRVPVSTRDSVDAMAFVFDRYFNLILTPATVDFKTAPTGGAGFSKNTSTVNGVAWMRMDSSAHEGRVKVTVALGKVEEARVIQQVAAEACALRIKTTESANHKIVIETDPVRDCSGNALPDGTIVSFTKVDGAGKSTVDTPIKKGVAQTQFTLSGPAKISVACGVVLGNEVTLNGKL